MRDGMLIFPGGAVKAKGEGRVSGYLVVFGDAENTDVTSFKDYFTADTDFGIEDGAKTAVWYRHSLDPSLDRVIGEGSLKTDEVGVWIDAQLDLRDRYCKAVYQEMAVKEKLGWSSGTALHLIKREKQDGGAHKIARWPLGLDASLTPDPAEPRTQAVALKSLVLDHPLSDLVPAEAPEAAAPAVKTLLGDYVLPSATMQAVRTLNDALFYNVLCGCVYNRVEDASDPAPLSERLAVMRQAFDEFRDLSLRVMEAILTSADGAESPDGAIKALKTLWGPDEPESLTDHTARVVAASAKYAERLESRLEARRNSGRALSEASRKDLGSVLSTLEEVEAVKSRLAAVLGGAPAPEAPADPGPGIALRAEALKSRIQLYLAAQPHSGSH